VTPGILMDEGVVEIQGGRFSVTLYPDQFGAEFANLYDHPVHIFEGFNPLRFYSLQAFLSGNTKKELSDTVEITIFIQGRNAEMQNVTAGGKYILRGSRVILPQQFLQDSPNE